MGVCSIQSKKTIKYLYERKCFCQLLNFKIYILLLFKHSVFKFNGKCTWKMSAKLNLLAMNGKSKLVLLLLSLFN